MFLQREGENAELCENRLTFAEKGCQHVPFKTSAPFLMCRDSRKPTPTIEHNKTLQ